MNRSLFLSVILSYALILVPSCKQRVTTKSYTKENVTKDASRRSFVDYDAWFGNFATLAKKENREAEGIINADFKGFYDEAVKDSGVRVYAIDPNNLQSKIPLQTPQAMNEVDRGNRRIFLQSPEREQYYFTVEVKKQRLSSAPNGNNTAKLLLQVHEDVYGSGKLEIIDGDATTIQTNNLNDGLLMKMIKAATHDFSFINSKYIIAESNKAEPQGLKLQDEKDEGLTIKEKFQIFFGLLALAIPAAMAWFTLGSPGDFRAMLPMLVMMVVVLAVGYLVVRVFTAAMAQKINRLNNAMDFGN